MKKSYHITGMSCAACAAGIERGVRRLDGVSHVRVNLLTAAMEVEFDPARIGEEAIRQTVAALGYGIQPPEESRKRAPAHSRSEAENEKRRLLFSLLFLVPLAALSMHAMFGFELPPALEGGEGALPFALAQLLLTLPVLVLNRGYFQRGIRALLKGIPNMDSLIAVGAGAGVVYSVAVFCRIAAAVASGDWAAAAAGRRDLYFESAAMILTLITFGKCLEARARNRTGDAIAGLMDLAPRTARVERGGRECGIPVSELVPGDIVLVRPGESIPADGTVLEGDSAVDQSALTGESVPVGKHPGDTVAAATINRSGFLRIRADRVGGETTLARIIRLMEEAASSKAPIARLADKIAGIFVPSVIAIAVAAAAVWLFCGATFSFALSIGIAVLVVSCPCALGLATPVAIMVGTGRGAQSGILIKSAEALEAAGSVDTVALDKTGTITAGTPCVCDILPAEDIEEEEFLTIAASLEKPSEHPLAKAVAAAAEARRLAPKPVREFTAIPGRGLSAVIGEERYFAGNAALMIERGIDTVRFRGRAETLAAEGKTPLFFADERRVLGLIALADTIKPTAKRAAEALRELGVEVVMLTGDSRRCAEAIQKQLRLDRVFAELLPQEKERVIRDLQSRGRRVAMVGDGINDAPALARADVGIAVGGGTDIAVDAADIVLMRDDPADVAAAVALSRAVLRNIRENLFWAFCYNIVGIPLAAGVFYGAFGWKLNPVFGAFAMSMSSVCVVGNALRLRFFHSEFNSAASSGNGGTEIRFRVTGMHCDHCRKKAESALRAVPGVDSAEVDPTTGEAVVRSAALAAEERLREAVERAGFRAEFR